VITRITGTLLETDPDVVVEVGGLGLAVQVPARERDALPPAGERVALWTHLAVREDGWTLYGFPAREDRELFRRLIGVSGIGPRLALGMLGAAPAAAIAAWIVQDDRKRLATLPGIGKRTAARLVTELADKLPPVAAPAPEPVAVEAGDAPEIPEMAVAEQLLAGMGLPAPRARRLLEQAREREPAVTEDPVRWVREALRLL